MGTLTGPDGQTISLMPHHTIGRNKSNALILPGKAVSNAHAEISWTTEGWMLLDMSSNGTYIDKRKARPGEPEAIIKGTEIAFAGSAWIMTCDAPPQPMARPASSRDYVVGEHNTLFLPDAEDVAVCVSQTASGWILERTGEPKPQPAFDEQEVLVNGQAWVLRLPMESAITIDSPELLLVEELKMFFTHSVDMEHFRLTLVAGSRSVSLEARSFHHTLFALASERLRDRDAGLSEAEAGWRSRPRFAQLAGVGKNTFDQHLFRARKELTALGLVYDADALIERRRGEVRLNISDIRIEALGSQAS